MSVYQRPLRPDELMHHGVKGQKWGVQNGPPYPLDGDISTGKSLRDTDNQQKENAKKINNRQSANKYAEEIIEESDGLRKQKQEIKEHKYSKYANDYYKNEEKYIDLVAEYLYDTELKNTDSDWNLDDVKELYRFGDFNQGSHTSQAMYMAVKGNYNPDESYDAFNKQVKWSDSCEEVAKKVLGRYGSQIIDGDKSSSDDWFSKNNQLSLALDQAESVREFINFSYNIAETDSKTIKEMQDWYKNRQ